MIQSLFLIAVAASVMLGGLIVFSTPKGDREWSPALAQTAVFEEVTPFTYHLKNLRRWEYAAPDEALRKDWAD
ncbi:MAG: hypothetical protein AAFY13_13170, partial [Pseudomonadota bacterium]